MSPVQNVRSDKQWKKRNEALKKAIEEFDLNSMSASLAKVARASRSVDVKLPRVERRRRSDVGGEDSFTTDLANPRSTRI